MSASQCDTLAEALVHQRVVRREAERHAVHAVFVLGAGMGAVVDVHQPGPVRALSQHALGTDGDAVDREQRGRVVAAARFVAGLERGALDLEADDTAELAHNAI